MLARCVATLKPPPELTLSQWADRYRMLSAESSAEPGRWHTDKAPYQREIMDAIGDAHIRRVVIMCAAQLGKTELLLNILGYFMAYAPAPILVMQPTLDMGQTFSKDRLAPMIRDTPVLRGLVDVKSRYAGNTILKKNFPGGHITIVGANSATGLASRPIKVLLADEVDRYPGSAGTEGDPLSLAQKRQTTFWDKKTVMVSTPVIKGHSRIETEYNQSTREEWNVPCPECGHYQPFVWANLIFDPDDLQKEIVYKCERCGCVANEYRWKQQSQQGRFVAENPGAETRGFHLNTLASTFCGWKEIVQKFIVAKEQLCAEINNANHGRVKLKFSVMGNWGVSAGNNLRLTGYGDGLNGGINGKYFVDKVTHKYTKSGGFVTSFECSGIFDPFHYWDVGGHIEYHQSEDSSSESYNSAYETTSPAANAASAAAGATAGAAVTLTKAPFYYTSVAPKPSCYKSGTFYFYDGILVNNRYRITNTAARCGKLPVGKNVTGWVPASYCNGGGITTK